MTFNQINSIIIYCNQVFLPTFSISVVVKWGRHLINVHFFTQQLQLLVLVQDSVDHIYILKNLGHYGIVHAAAATDRSRY